MVTASWRPLFLHASCGCIFWDDGIDPWDCNPQLHWCRQHWVIDRARGLRELRDRGLLGWPKVTQSPAVSAPIAPPTPPRTA